MANEKNLKPFKKGDPRASECGKKSKRRSLEQIWADKIDPDVVFDEFWRLFKKGNVKAGQEILNRALGKVKERVDITTGDERLNSISDLSTEELIKRAEAIKKIDEQA